MRAFASEVYRLPPHRVIGSVGATEFRDGPDGPELIKGDVIQVINDGPQKPSSIHAHVGQRPILAAGNTDGDLAMLQWTAASSHRTLQLVVNHTDQDREYAYTRDPSWAADRPGSRRSRREQVDRDRHGGRLVGRLPAASLAGGARTRRYPTWAPRPAQYGARSWRLSTLPEPVRGSSAAKSTERGTL